MEAAQRLINWFRDKEGVLIAFSGGVDSAVVAKAAYDALGDKAIAATARSATMPSWELEDAKRVAREIGIRHVIFHEDEFETPGFAENPPDRCYHCRKGLVKGLKEVARRHGIDCIVDGANADDTREHRPGMQAMRESDVKSPLLELELGKETVRRIARHFKLSVSDKPPMACLASRVPYGEKITREKLQRIEKAEGYLRRKGFRTLRVRHHNGIARIEVGEDEIPKVIEHRKEITRKLKEMGFTYVSLDLEGYRSGSMDEALTR